MAEPEKPVAPKMAIFMRKRFGSIQAKVKPLAQTSVKQMLQSRYGHEAQGRCCALRPHHTTLKIGAELHYTPMPENCICYMQYVPTCHRLMNRMLLSRLFAPARFTSNQSGTRVCFPDQPSIPRHTKSLGQRCVSKAQLPTGMLFLHKKTAAGRCKEQVSTGRQGVDLNH
jgi:hypothetical protein